MVELEFPDNIYLLFQPILKTQETWDIILLGREEVFSIIDHARALETSLVHAKRKTTSTNKV